MNTQDNKNIESYIKKTESLILSGEYEEAILALNEILKIDYQKKDTINLQMSTLFTLLDKAIELAEYREFFNDASPLLDKLEDSPELIKSILYGNISMELVEEFNMKEESKKLKYKYDENEERIISCPKCQSTGNIKKDMCDNIICRDCGHVEESNEDRD